MGNRAALFFTLSGRLMLFCPGVHGLDILFWENSFSDGKKDKNNVQIGRMIRRAVRAVVPPMIFLGIAGYFGWNATQGDHGMKAYQQQLLLLDQAKQSQQDAVAEQAAWRRRVNGLREQSLDTDTLDERARAMLNLADKNDIVVPYDRRDPLY